MPEAHENSLCCGGGGRIWMETSKEERFSDLRLEQATGIGAEVLATCCPYCITRFEESRLALADSESQEAAGGNITEIKDITEIIQEAIS
jgi:Fe-S oxidoreductase